MHDVFELIGHVADTTTTVLIDGETGTGKEQVARAIHQASASTATGPFVAVNCAALPRTCWRASCSATRRGRSPAPTGQRKGRFELADGGTLFLDEVGDVPAVDAGQAAARAPGAAVRARRRHRADRGRRPGDRRDEPGRWRSWSRTASSARTCTTGSTWSRSTCRRCATGPRTSRCWSSHFCQKYARPGQQPPTGQPRGDGGAAEVPLAGQRPPAGERHRAGLRDGPRRRDPPKNLPPDVGRADADGKQHPFQVDLTRPLPDQLAELTAEFEERYLRKALKKTRGHVGKCAKISGLSRRSITDKIANTRSTRASSKRPIDSATPNRVSRRRNSARRVLLCKDSCPRWR